MLHLTLNYNLATRNDFHFTGPPIFISFFAYFFTFLYIYTYMCSPFPHKLIYISYNVDTSAIG